MSRTFESSSAGRLGDDAVLECGVCWWVYDPARGDEVWDIAPGTPFSALAGDYRCPSCDAPKSKFMLLSAGSAGAQPVLPDMETRIADLTAAYERAEASMLGLPVHNPKLRIEAVGFEPYGEAYAGIIITPWSMNLVILPEDPAAPLPGPLGSNRAHAFPSGRYDFITGRMEGVGTVETCSLFSPMDMFDDADVAKATAQSAIEGLMTPEAPPEPPQQSRRALFTGAGAR